MLSSVVRRPILKRQSGGGAAKIVWEICFLFCSLLIGAVNSAAAQQSPSAIVKQVKLVVDQYCISCHDTDSKKGGLDLERINLGDIAKNSDEWERVIHKLR